MSNATTVPPAVAPAFVAAAPSFISDGNANAVVPIPDFPIELPVDYDPYSTSVNITLRETASCPAGYICNTTHQASCFDIRQAAVDYFKYGDIHAGAYCPEGSPFYLECPLGSYCPDPVTVLPCPAGKFCPHKTAVPEIYCQNCVEGATEMARGTFGIVLLFCFLILVGIYLVFTFIRRRVEFVRVKLKTLTSRIMSVRDVEKRQRDRRERLKKIRPKLALIQRRLHHMDTSIKEEVEEEETAQLDVPLGNDSSLKDSGLVVGDGDNIVFDVHEFFETLDTVRDGALSYDELNAVLRLDPLSLKAFVKRMNALDDSASSDLTHVSKATFCKYFLDVLEETSNFRLTPKEAGERWDEIFNETGANSVGEIRLASLYDSPTLSHFLSDIEINTVISKFKEIKRNTANSNPTQAPPSQFSFRNKGFFNSASSDGITRDLFVEHFPFILEEILQQDNIILESTKDKGIDIAFKNLQLSVKVGSKNYVNVVDDVTGRIRKGTMTALLGGSGAGKTSLLNALCGRAYYGEVKGDIMINGNRASLEDFSGSIGFVPQDDIVFAELTVMENLMYSGRFRLPRGTPLYEIEDLAETVVCNLGLARKKNSLVGDVTRRGLSGGEKKRVNMGLELMAMPAALFLDEPTSGLDASSALLVMKSLKQLVKNQGVTVCSVIHQPRKFIFDLFDSLLLLGVGGRMVYHGTVPEAGPYFRSLGYVLPPGESVADWLIDISTGRIAADNSLEMEDEEEVVVSKPRSEPNMSSRGMSIQNLRLDKANTEGRPASAGNKLAVLTEEPTRLAAHAVTPSGPSGIKQEKAGDEAKIRRELLYQSWSDHFQALDGDERSVYDPPDPSDLPQKAILPSFWTQLCLQLQRIFLLGWRNRSSKMIELFILVVAVAVITFTHGTVELSSSDGKPPLIPFGVFITGQPKVFEVFFPALFEFSLRAANGYLRYGVSVGVIAGVLIALVSSKVLTVKRLEFFRESGSGYSVNAYFLAVNIYTSLDQGLQMLFAAIIAQWMLHTISNMGAFYVAFLLLAWVSISWALLIPLITDPGSTVVVLTFLVAFFGLLCSGTSPPVTFKDIYSSDGTALFSAFFSAPRFFTETLAVSDFKCLPSQSGFTQAEDATGFPDGVDSFSVIPLGQNDGTVNVRSTDGWYWNALPAFFVGLSIRLLAFAAINVLNRSKQAKKSFWFQLRHRGSTGLYVRVALFVICLGGLIGATCWMVLRDTVDAPVSEDTPVASSS